LSRDELLELIGDENFQRYKDARDKFNNDLAHDSELSLSGGAIEKIEI